MNTSTHQPCRLGPARAQLRTVALALTLSVLAAATPAAPGELLRFISNPIPNQTNSSYFGNRLLVSGNAVFISACFDQRVGQPMLGAVFIVDLKSNTLLRTIQGPQAAAGGWFGYGTAIKGTTLLVGAPYAQQSGYETGIAYLYNWKTGALMRTIAPALSTNTSWLGFSAAFSGNTIILGAPKSYNGLTYSGQIWFDSLRSGTLPFVVGDDSPAAIEFFGELVLASGNVIFAGTPSERVGNPSVGAVALLDAKTGGYKGKIPNPAPDAGDRFGAALAVSGSRLYIGEPYGDASIDDAGKVHIYDMKTQVKLSEIANPTPVSQQQDEFGASLAVKGNLVVISAPRKRVGALHAGAVYLFDTSGNLLRTIANPYPADYDGFGQAVAFGPGNTLLVSAPQHLLRNHSCGVVYVYDVKMK